jgi:tRNA(Ile2) C34 agmatinyltransferase TiaS
MVYVLRKECRNIGKEAGDYYNGEYGNSPEKIAELVAKGVIIDEDNQCERCGGEMSNRSAGDESYRRCGDCGHVDAS